MPVKSMAGGVRPGICRGRHALVLGGGAPRRRAGLLRGNGIVQADELLRKSHHCSVDGLGSRSARLGSMQITIASIPTCWARCRASNRNTSTSGLAIAVALRCGSPIIRPTRGISGADLRILSPNPARPDRNRWPPAPSDDGGNTAHGSGTPQIASVW